VNDVRSRVIAWGLAWLALGFATPNGASQIAAAAEPRGAAAPLPQAHAHNDYYHARPLLDALDHGFCSVEADVYLVEGQLLVGHDRDELRPDRTLQALYLDPLAQLVAQRGGALYPDGPPLTLLIDFKSEGAATYEALRAALLPYRALLDGGHTPPRRDGPVRIIVSGNRPFEAIANDPERLVGVDGRLEDLARDDRPADLVPLISDTWSKRFTWQGSGAMPEDERRLLRDLAGQAHARGQRLRFWATAEREALWHELATAGVDLIGTDDLGALQKFLSARH
jgi:hypothetical protein